MLLKTAVHYQKLICRRKLESVGESAFYGCTALKDITFQENVQSIGSYAFSRCTELKKIVFEGDAPEIQTVLSQELELL